MAPYKPPADAHYAHVVTDFSLKQMLEFMGKGGQRFKRFTEMNKLEYVWWNKEMHLIEMWGNHKDLTQCVQHMKNMMETFRMRYIQENKVCKRCYDVSGYDIRNIVTLIGKGGVNIKWIRDDHDLKNIWWNQETKMFELFGRNKDTEAAVQDIIHNLQMIENRFKNYNKKEDINEILNNMIEASVEEEQPSQEIKETPYKNALTTKEEIPVEDSIVRTVSNMINDITV